MTSLLERDIPPGSIYRHARYGLCRVVVVGEAYHTREHLVSVAWFGSDVPIEAPAPAAVTVYDLPTFLQDLTLETPAEVN